jgi:hypothetical protein
MANGESVEKLQGVMDVLQASPHVVVATHFDGSQTDGQRQSLGSRTLDIFAYPTIPLYDPEALNDLMFGLTELSPTRLDYFSFYFECVERRDQRLVLGRLCFDETVANTALSSRALQQCTSLRLFPDAGHLFDAVNGYNQYDIPVYELGQRIVGQPDA